jgi:SAM-dependent methyltransferase
LPFPDGSFEVVCCQLRLQFFPDPSGALAEMARVLVPGGRVAVMVWRSIHHSPEFAALAGALDRHIGSAAKVEPCRPAARSRIGETLDSADAFHVQMQEPAAAATKLFSSQHTVGST